ncbi:putative L-gulonolactone oxidase 6, partial [Ananas comosus]
VTLKLQPLFKRSVTFAKYGDADLADRAVTFGNQHEFADMAWYPGQGKVIYRIDDRVPDNVSGNGVFNFVGFRSTATLLLATNRLAEEGLEATGNAGGRCQYSRLTTSAIAIDGYGLTNNGLLFTGYPVVGFQNKIQSSGGCLDGPDDALLTACPWDPRVRGEFFHQTTVSIPLSEAKDFILDVQKLRDLNAEAFCGVELYNGILMRYVKSSSAYLGKQDDCLDFDITYYRSHDPAVPRLYEDVLEEVEQMALFKYGGMPHWGKNRNVAFDGVIAKYPKIGEFLRVKNEYDPQGLFSSEWTDQVLGIKGRASIYKQGCALEGLCICSEDAHCAPDRGYYCRPGKVYKDARVCTKS